MADKGRFRSQGCTPCTAPQKSQNEPTHLGEVPVCMVDCLPGHRFRETRRKDPLLFAPGQKRWPNPLTKTESDTPKDVASESVIGLIRGVPAGRRSRYVKRGPDLSSHLYRTTRAPRLPRRFGQLYHPQTTNRGRLHLLPTQDRINEVGVGVGWAGW